MALAISQLWTSLYLSLLWLLQGVQSIILARKCAMVPTAGDGSAQNLQVMWSVSSTVEGPNFFWISHLNLLIRIQKKYWRRWPGAAPQGSCKNPACGLGHSAKTIVCSQVYFATNGFTYFFLFSSTPSAFHPLRGNSLDWKFVSPNILA